MLVPFGALQRLQRTPARRPCRPAPTLAQAVISPVISRSRSDSTCSFSQFSALAIILLAERIDGQHERARSARRPAPSSACRPTAAPRRNRLARSAPASGSAAATGSSGSKVKGALVVGDGAWHIIVDLGDAGGEKGAGERADLDRLVGLLGKRRRRPQASCRPPPRTPASHLLRPSRIEFLPAAPPCAPRRELIAALTAKHGLFGVGVQSAPFTIRSLAPAPAIAEIRRRG